jgi:hypothetical protein
MAKRATQVIELTWEASLREEDALAHLQRQGHLPSPEEARERLESLRVYGEKPYAFTLKNAFPAPDESTPASAPTP